MLTYALILIVCIISTFIAHKSATTNKFVFFVTSIIAIVVPACIAGLRGIHCGVDILVYCKPAFDRVAYYDSFIKYYESSDIDLFFSMLMYATYHLFGTFNMALFNIELFILLFFYIASYKLRDIIPMWMSYPLLLIGFYALSFNLMRQSLAIAFLMLGYTYLLRNDNFKKYLVFLIISFFWHKTAVIGGLFLLFIHFASVQKKELRIILSVSFISVCTAIIIIFRVLLSMIALLGGRFETYEAYGKASGSFTPTISTILLLGNILCICLAVTCYYMRILNGRTSYNYTLICIVSTMSELLGMYTGYATRIGMYFAATQAFYLPIIATSPKLTNRTSFIAVIVVFAIFIAVWLRLHASMGNTVPYSSTILDI
ncbi:MAG: EpsG family protein [Bacteroidales bacterium]|jgi:hypothetical protein|nr:EpsG family protein [Bacteroidales bacterium]